jgi:anti-anti-sigma regulatory factor
MASNFKISIHRNSDNLHLRLVGDFDGTSAHQLLNTLKVNSRGASNVFIHTNCLKRIHPFGSNVFRRNLDQINKDNLRLVFTGEHSQQLAPKGSTLF